MSQADLLSLVASRRPGEGLSRSFYEDDGLYRSEIEAIWRRSWLFCALSAELPSPGSFVRVALDGDDVVVLRQGDGGLAALHNVCRHRGSLIVEAEAGQLSRLICPYHGWTYELDGSLRSCPGLDVDKSSYPLRELAVREVGGLVFIAFDAKPDDSEQFLAKFGAALEDQGIGRGKVAVRINYEIAANWKLVWENNRECLHCAINHPQYSRLNFDQYVNGLPTLREHEFGDQARALAVKHRSGDLHDTVGLADFPGPGLQWYSTTRTVMRPGFLVESLDGSPIAPLMGDIEDYDSGTLRLRCLPNFWAHASADHVVVTRLFPLDCFRTSAQVSWLVDADAVEGRDYERAKLVAVWQATSEQDWAICERQQRGVRSSAYRPGPLSPVAESNVDQFLAWYQRALTDHLEVAAANGSAPRQI